LVLAYEESKVNNVPSFRGIFAVVLGLVLIVAFSLSLKSFLSPPPPTLEVTNVSLNPTAVNVGSLSTLSISIKSNDAAGSHFLRIDFGSHVLVTFLIGNQSLPIESGKYYFTTTMNPSGQITQPFGVRATLESGIAQLVYQISVDFYLDGNQFDSRTLELTVNA
jgi:hypothetical protein